MRDRLAWPAAAAAVVVVVVAMVEAAVLGGCSSPALSSTGSHPSTSGAPRITRSSTTTTPPGPAPPNVTLPKPWPTRVIASVDYSAPPVVPLGSHTAVGLVPAGSQPASSERFVSVDLETGKLRGGPEVTDGSFLLPGPRGLYLVSRLGTDGALLGSVDVATLRVTTTMPVHGIDGVSSLSTSFQTAGPHAGDLWIPVLDGVELVDPHSGAVLVRAYLPAGPVVAVAAEPDGRYVDVAVSTATRPISRFVLLALDASSGAIVARSMPENIVGGSIVTVPGGFWLSTFDGMYGRLIRYVEPLSPVSARPPVPLDGENGNLPAPGGAANGSMEATLAGDVVVLTDISGASCTSESGTSVLAEAPFPGGSATTFGRPWTPFAGIGRTVFAITSSADSGAGTVIAVSLPPAC